VGGELTSDDQVGLVLVFAMWWRDHLCESIERYRIC